MSAIHNNSFELPVSNRLSGTCFFILAGLRTVRIVLANEHTNSDVLSERYGDAIEGEVINGKVVIPSEIRAVLGAYDGKQYFTYGNPAGDEFTIEIEEDRCCACEQPERETFRLMPLHSKFVCEGCYEALRRYMLVAI